MIQSIGQLKPKLVSICSILLTVCVALPSFAQSEDGWVRQGQVAHPASQRGAVKRPTNGSNRLRVNHSQTARRTSVQHQAAQRPLSQQRPMPQRSKAMAPTVQQRATHAVRPVAVRPTFTRPARVARPARTSTKSYPVKGVTFQLGPGSKSRRVSRSAFEAEVLQQGASHKEITQNVERLEPEPEPLNIPQEEIISSDIYYESEPSYGVGESCYSGGYGPYGDCVPLCLPRIQEMTLFAGVQAFKGPYDRSGENNFGFQEGINIGGRIPLVQLPGFAYQLGYRGVHSQLSGDSAIGTSDAHTQQFFTVGVYHRTDIGLQFGVVWDFLRDERIVQNDFTQIRAEISLINLHGTEFGLRGAFSGADQVREGTLFSPTDQYLFFYRKTTENGSVGQIFAGVDDDSNGIVGAELTVPVNNRWSLQTGFTYLIPEEDQAGVGATHEAWNLGIGFVWNYGCRARTTGCRPFQPLFNVADNGSMIIDRAN